MTKEQINNELQTLSNTAEALYQEVIRSNMEIARLESMAIAVQDDAGKDAIEAQIDALIVRQQQISSTIDKHFQYIDKLVNVCISETNNIQRNINTVESKIAPTSFIDSGHVGVSVSKLRAELTEYKNLLYQAEAATVTFQNAQRAIRYGTGSSDSSINRDPKQLQFIDNDNYNNRQSKSVNNYVTSYDGSAEVGRQKTLTKK